MFDLSKFIDYPAYIKVAALVWVILTLFLSAALLFIKPTQTGHGSTSGDNLKTSLKKETDKELTLLYLFENDFNNLLRAGENLLLEDEKGHKTTVKSKLYLDFVAQNEFVGFFIPNTPETLNICVYLAKNYTSALKLKDKTMVEMSAPGIQPVNSAELKFSGRIFIYHEYPILEAQKRELFALYEKQGLSPQFRGSEYLFSKKETAQKLH